MRCNLRTLKVQHCLSQILRSCNHFGWLILSELQMCITASPRLLLLAPSNHRISG